MKCLSFKRASFASKKSLTWTPRVSWYIYISTHKINEDETCRHQALQGTGESSLHDRHTPRPHKLGKSRALRGEEAKWKTFFLSNIFLVEPFVSTETSRMYGPCFLFLCPKMNHLSVDERFSMRTHKVTKKFRFLYNKGVLHDDGTITSFYN